MEGKTNSTFSAPTMCTKCCAFYANPQFGNYCSKCYKELGLPFPQETNTAKAAPQLTATDATADVQNSVKQADAGLCWACSKKAGMMAYKCKCEYTFCKKHRLPESHNCEFDFVNEGRQVLAKANPNCQTDKIERL